MSVKEIVIVRDGLELRVDGEIRCWGTNLAAMQAMIDTDTVPAYWGEHCGDTEADVTAECEALEEQGIRTGMYRD